MNTSFAFKKTLHLAFAAIPIPAARLIYSNQHFFAQMKLTLNSDSLLALLTLNVATISAMM